MFRKIISILMILVIAAGLCSCGNVGVSKEKYTATYWEYFDTVISLIAYCEDEEEFSVIDSKAKELYRYYNRLFDIYNDYDGLNNAKTINDNAGKVPVAVDAELVEMISYAKDLYYTTDGNVNIAFGSVLRVWHEAREFATENPDKAYVPDVAILQAAAQHCCIEDVIVDAAAGTVFLADSELSIDLGAIAKGYATELVAKALEEQGYSNILISAGGNARAVGSKPDGSSWVIGIQNPDKEASEYASIIEVNNKSVVTSGTYERYYDVDGIRYHHIINKDSLMPENYFLSVTIVTDDSGFADALSTAVFNMPLEEGKSFVESLDGVEAMWILDDYSLEYTDGFEKLKK